MELESWMYSIKKIVSKYCERIVDMETEDLSAMKEICKLERIKKIQKRDPHLQIRRE